MRLGKCVVSLPPLGRLQKKKKKKSERGSRVMFFLGRRSLYFDSFICWVTHSLLVSLSLSAAGPDGALRKPGAQTEPSRRACTQTHTVMRKHNFCQCLRCSRDAKKTKNPKKKRRFRGQTHLKAPLPSSSPLCSSFSIFCLPRKDEVNAGPSLISPPSV